MLSSSTNGVGLDIGEEVGKFIHPSHVPVSVLLKVNQPFGKHSKYKLYMSIPYQALQRKRDVGPVIKIDCLGKQPRCRYLTNLAFETLSRAIPYSGHSFDAVTVTLPKIHSYEIELHFTNPLADTSSIPRVLTGVYPVVIARDLEEGSSSIECILPSHDGPTKSILEYFYPEWPSLYRRMELYNRGSTYSIPLNRFLEQIPLQETFKAQLIRYELEDGKYCGTYRDTKGTQTFAFISNDPERMSRMGSIKVGASVAQIFMIAFQSNER